MTCDFLNFSIKRKHPNGPNGVFVASVLVDTGQSWEHRIKVQFTGGDEEGSSEHDYLTFPEAKRLIGVLKLIMEDE